METVRQHKMGIIVHESSDNKARTNRSGSEPAKDKIVQAVKEGSAGGSGDAVVDATERTPKGRKRVAEWKLHEDKSRGDVHKGIVDDFLTPVKNDLLQHREYRRVHSRQEIEEKFGPGGVKGFKGWVASQKSQENARRDRLKNKSGLDSTGKLTRFELLRSQMFSNQPPRCVRSPSTPGGKRGENSHGGARKGPVSEKRARNESGGGTRNDFVGPAAFEGHDSFDIDDSEDEFEDPTRWTSSGGKGKARVSEAPPNEPDSFGDLEGGSTAGGSGIRDGADGRDDVFNVSGAGDVVDMTMDKALDGEDDDSVVEREEFASDTLACSPPTPDSASDKRHSRGRRNHVTGVLDEMRTSCIETKRYNDARLALSAEMGRGQMESSKRIADAFAMMASGNSGGGANTNGAGTVTTVK